MAAPPIKTGTAYTWELLIANHLDQSLCRSKILLSTVGDALRYTNVGVKYMKARPCHDISIILFYFFNHNYTLDSTSQKLKCKHFVLLNITLKFQLKQTNCTKRK